MFSRSSRTPIQTETLATLIDASVSITGEVRFEKSARIDGTVTGDVTGSKTKANRKLQRLGVYRLYERAHGFVQREW